MFPAEGERVPKRRFPGFTDDWELRNVGEICRISTGKSNTQDREEQGKFPFYVRSPIIEKSTKYLFDEEAVLTVGDGVGTGKVFHYVHGKYDLHQRVYRMFSFTHVNAKYFYYYFSKKFFDRVMAMTAKNSVDSVRLEMISDMEITIPQLEEQEKIVKILSTLDQQITLHQRKLEKLKNLKKALLNELFV
ncbi:TPA: restriction endonuclease subunit S [Streptococcus suis]|nr:restriction endonuclease subunit S [Streptococcus suis]